MDRWDEIIAEVNDRGPAEAVKDVLRELAHLNVTPFYAYQYDGADPYRDTRWRDCSTNIRAQRMEHYLHPSQDPRTPQTITRLRAHILAARNDGIVPTPSIIDEDLEPFLPSQPGTPYDALQQMTVSAEHLCNRIYYYDHHFHQEHLDYSILQMIKFAEQVHIAHDKLAAALGHFGQARDADPLINHLFRNGIFTKIPYNFVNPHETRIDSKDALQKTLDLSPDIYQAQHKETVADAEQLMQRFAWVETYLNRDIIPALWKERDPHKDGPLDSRLEPYVPADLPQPIFIKEATLQHLYHAAMALHLPADDARPKQQQAVVKYVEAKSYYKDADNHDFTQAYHTNLGDLDYDKRLFVLARAIAIATQPLEQPLLLASKKTWIEPQKQAQHALHTMQTKRKELGVTLGEKTDKLYLATLEKTAQAFAKTVRAEIARAHPELAEPLSVKSDLPRIKRPASRAHR